MNPTEDEYYNDMAASDAARDLAIEDGSAFDVSAAAAALGRKGGRIGGKSTSDAKRAAAKSNLARAREVRKTKRETMPQPKEIEYFKGDCGCVSMRQCSRKKSNGAPGHGENK